MKRRVERVSAESKYLEAFVPTLVTERGGCLREDTRKRERERERKKEGRGVQEYGHAPNNNRPETAADGHGDRYGP